MNIPNEAVEATANEPRYIVHDDPMWESHEKSVSKDCACDYTKVQNGLWLTIAIRRDLDPACPLHGDAE